MDATNIESAGQPNVEDKRCPWCSMVLADPSAAVCPECGAALIENPAVDATGIPGVTVIDPEVKLAERRAARQMQRAKTTGNATMFGITGVLLSKAFSSVQGPREDEESDLLDGEGTTGLTPTGLAPGGVLMAPGITPAPSVVAPAAAPVPPATEAMPASAGPPAAVPFDLPPGAMPATYVPVAMPTAPSQPEGGEAESSVDPWRDLPAASIEDQIAGTDMDPWAAQTQADEDAARPFDPWATQTTDPWSVDGGPWSDANPPQWTAENQAGTITSRPDESGAAESTGDEPPEK
jgi:hypothetical protein